MASPRTDDSSEKPERHPLWPMFMEKMKEKRLDSPKLFNASWSICWEWFLAGSQASSHYAATH